MGKKHDRIAAKASATVKARHKKDEPKPEVVAEATSSPVIPEPEAAEPVAEVKTSKKKQPKAVTEAGLAPLPRMAQSASKAERKPKPTADCACGCGGQTRGLWVPGHDARAKGWAMRIERGIITMDGVPANEQPGAKRMLAERKAAGTTAPNIKLVAKPEPVAVNE